MYFQRITSKFYKICKLRRHVSVGAKFSDNRVIKSKAANLIIPNQLIPDYIWQDLGKWHDKTAVVCFETGKSYTFNQVYLKCRNLAGSLRRKFSLEKGDTVAVILPNVVDFPVAFLGAIQAGLVVTTVNPLHNADEMARQLSDSGAKIIFTVRDILTVVNTAMSILGEKIPTVIAEAQPADCFPQGCIKMSELCDNSNNNGNALPEGSPDDVAILPYSSGTTGFPKGVQLTHRNVVSNLYQMSSPDFIVNLKTEGSFQDVIPVFLPLFHIYGMVGIFLNFFAQGCKLVMIPNFIGSQFIKLLQYYQPTLLFAVPPMIVVVLNNPKIKVDDLKSVRTIISAAAPLGSLSVEEFNDKSSGKITLLQMYGMTETSPLTLMQTPKLANGTKIGGSGFLIPNTEAQIIPQTSAQSGELLVRGPQIMKGYHNNPEATRDAILQDGWLRTGDICYYDEHQHFFITDRLKELIKVKGFQVAPAELEEILMSHSAVVDAAVVGIPHPVHGEAPKAFIVVKKGQSVNTDHVKEFVAAKVSSYKRLVGGVVVTEKIPRNCAGKILRNELKNM
ncbi:uncharacterized protein LOC135140853 [Zophobas morio]|uniref:uncharacterized protein LOC135140853 n=1 Tax=Zophobas morio TaxID=2755281 RepID=UPI003082B63C